MYPFIPPLPAPRPAVTSGLPTWLPPIPFGYVRVRISCIPCGLRCDPDVDDVAKFLLEHGDHIRKFLEGHSDPTPVPRRPGG